MIRAASFAGRADALARGVGWSDMGGDVVSTHNTVPATIAAVIASHPVAEMTPEVDVLELASERCRLAFRRYLSEEDMFGKYLEALQDFRDAIDVSISLGANGLSTSMSWDADATRACR